MLIGFEKCENSEEIIGQQKEILYKEMIAGIWNITNRLIVRF